MTAILPPMAALVALVIIGVVAIVWAVSVPVMVDRRAALARRRRQQPRRAVRS